MSDKYERFKAAVKEMIVNRPDWVGNQEILVLAGMEVLVDYVPGDPIKIKTTRCNFCGDCCLDFPPTPFENDEEGRCVKLERTPQGEWKCTAGFDKPYKCLLDVSKANSPDCVIEHDLIEI